MPPQSSALSQYTSPIVAGLHGHPGAELRARRGEPTRDATVAGTSVATSTERRPVGTNTLPVVAQILRKAGIPLSVRQLVERAGAELPTRSKTPLTVVARDLAMDIKKKGEASAYVRTSPGRYTLRELVFANRNSGSGTGAPQATTEQPTDPSVHEHACIAPRI